MKNLSAIEKYRAISPLLAKEMTAVEASAGSGVPCRTIRRWVKEFAADGLEGLGRKKRSDKANPRLMEELLQTVDDNGICLHSYLIAIGGGTRSSLLGHAF